MRRSHSKRAIENAAIHSFEDTQKQGIGRHWAVERGIEPVTFWLREWALLTAGPAPQACQPMSSLLSPCYLSTACHLIQRHKTCNRMNKEVRGVANVHKLLQRSIFFFRFSRPSLKKIIMFRIIASLEVRMTISIPGIGSLIRYGMVMYGIDAHNHPDAPTGRGRDG